MPVDHVLPRRQEPVKPSTGVEPQHLPQHIRVAPRPVTEPVMEEQPLLQRSEPVDVHHPARLASHPREDRRQSPSFSPASGSIPAVSSPPMGITARGGTTTGSAQAAAASRAGLAAANKVCSLPAPPAPAAAPPAAPPAANARRGRRNRRPRPPTPPRAPRRTPRTGLPPAPMRPPPGTRPRAVIRGRRRGQVHLPVPRHRQPPQPPPPPTAPCTQATAPPAPPHHPARPSPRPRQRQRCPRSQRR